MPRQLTPEEMRVIRETEDAGARLAEEESRKHFQKCKTGNLRRLGGSLIFVLVFVLFVLLAYLVVSSTMK